VIGHHLHQTPGLTNTAIIIITINIITITVIEKMELITAVTMTTTQLGNITEHFLIYSKAQITLARHV